MGVEGDRRSKVARLKLALAQYSGRQKIACYNDSEHLCLRNISCGDGFTVTGAFETQTHSNDPIVIQALMAIEVEMLHKTFHEIHGKKNCQGLLISATLKG